MMIVKDIEYFALTEQILLAYVVDEEDGDEALSFDDVVSELKEQLFGEDEQEPEEGLFEGGILGEGFNFLEGGNKFIDEGNGKGETFGKGEDLVFELAVVDGGDLHHFLQVIEELFVIMGFLEDAVDGQNNSIYLFALHP